jgi:DNA-binding transcriptional ArsR family regulator
MRVTRSGNWRMSATRPSRASTDSGAGSLAFLREAEQAAVLLHHPLRLRILEALLQPDSATGVARRMGLPRQTVNYHVRELARVRLLARAGRRRRRHLYEQCYVATARRYVLSPELLGSLAADPAHIGDASSADYLLALASQPQAGLARSRQWADEAGQRPVTFSIDAAARFTSPVERAAFLEELRKAVFEAVDRHGAASGTLAGIPATSRAFRIVVGCFPIASTR